jgi:hypothetical protein
MRQTVNSLLIALHPLLALDATCQCAELPSCEKRRAGAQLTDKDLPPAFAEFTFGQNQRFLLLGET